MELRGYGGRGYPDITIYFHYFWNGQEPEDGEYSMEQVTYSGSDVYTAAVSSLFEGINYSAGSGKLYVKHVNGKLQVAFCSLSLSGSNGSFSGTTTAQGKITAP
ncbi:hypothetical protein HNQ91_004628 [Filimonas zeae]|uniref:Uncharacterized protein n=1 Tax=Filimonas zeae TaxID=1737353 RepID=A0A917J2B0_9BACT|nr:hypothetical protein [Filimonas zeae]MDR6341555.1 hypothetical protein [Filimonas zeae]GGH75290.1 hypothetical protein GCM10011379_38730 [Filimonas zeae]